MKPEKITGTSHGPFYILDQLTMICSRAQTADVELAIERDWRLFTNHLVTCEDRQTQELPKAGAA